MSKKNTKKAKAKAAITRKGIILISLLAVMILIVSIVTFSYSWFEPQTLSGKGLSLRRTPACAPRTARLKPIGARS